MDLDLKLNPLRRQLLEKLGAELSDPPHPEPRLPLHSLSYLASSTAPAHRPSRPSNVEAPVPPPRPPPPPPSVPHLGRFNALLNAGSPLPMSPTHSDPRRLDSLNNTVSQTPVLVARKPLHPGAWLDGDRMVGSPLSLQNGLPDRDHEYEREYGLGRDYPYQPQFQSIHQFVGPLRSFTAPQVNTPLYAQAEGRIQSRNQNPDIYAQDIQTHKSVRHESYEMLWNHYLDPISEPDCLAGPGPGPDPAFNSPPTQRHRSPVPHLYSSNDTYHAPIATTASSLEVPGGACQIAKDMELRKAFTKQLSEGAKEPKAQMIVDYLNFILHEGWITERSDWIQTLRLLYKLAESTQVYPKRLLLRGIEMAKEPFEGGGFADVFEGKYQDHEVCIKVIRIFGKAQQAQILKAYIREIVLWSHMSHQNILPFYGVYTLDESSQRICLISPLIQNGNLKAFLEQNPEALRLPLIQGIVEGLSYLHHWNIVHGDLKAQNVLVSNDGRPLITDFGLSYIVMTAAAGSTQLSAAGTTNWMAPELINSQNPKPTKMSDIWSFGCLCYEMYTGKYPFYHCSTLAMVIVALARGEPPIRPHTADTEGCRQLDDWAWNLMLECWRYDPEARYTCEMIIAALAAKLPPGNPLKDSHWEEDKHVFWRAMRAQSKNADDSSFRDAERIIIDFLDGHKN